MRKHIPQWKLNKFERNADKKYMSYETVKDHHYSGSPRIHLTALKPSVPKSVRRIIVVDASELK